MNEVDTMIIHGNFVGGNIKVEKSEGDVFYLNNELRDTEGDWFYWAFCVENAEGRTLTFKFPEVRLGYYGPAVSHDLENWEWYGRLNPDRSFTYTFGEGENKVYFAHNMLYHPDRFYRLARQHGIDIQELCKSRKGRSVPSLVFGSGSKSIIMTARHHACESTGSYVLEGVLRELSEAPVEDATIFCVPFVDYDGVVDGDQGKARSPHDHNRDYDPECFIYPETTAIKAYADKNGCNYGFDFHSPAHKGGENDNVFIVRNSVEKNHKTDRFARILESKITPSSMKYQASNDHPPMTGWNRPGPSFGYTMMHRPECEIAHTIECTYAGTEDNKVSIEKMIELGRCYARAIKEYIYTVNE